MNISINLNFLTMNIYSRKQKFKFSLFIAALIVGVSSILYSNNLVKKLAKEERTKVELWAQAVKEIQETPIDREVSITLSKMLEYNTTIPVILTDGDGKIITNMNFDPFKVKQKKYLQNQLELMKEQNEAIVINFSEDKKNYVYYKESILLSNLFYYPLIQMFVIGLFIGLGYLAFSASRRAEENQVWVGMSKETAHQLGTPLSSLLAWVEMLKMSNDDTNMVQEVEKDVKRLETITERFSKIGSKPKLVETNLIHVLSESVSYLKSRTSERVKYITHFNKDSILTPMNVALFEWVIENLCKNAIDAMGGTGSIIIETVEKNDSVIIDISDTGKGIPKSKFKTVFKPGFTTKKRGWGLGLSLTKRIVESYHKGKIFIKSSEINKGTCFRIILKK